MATLNELSAIIAIVLLLLASVGMRGAFSKTPSTAADFLMLALFHGTSAIFCRLATWDIVISLILSYDESLRDVTRYWGNHANTFYNLWISYAAILACRAGYLLIPESVRHHYTWLTAPFYPRRAFSRWLRRDDE